MTAWNIVAQRDAAYLIHDTAAYLPDGTVVQFLPKVLFLTGAVLNPAAMALTGCVAAAEIAPFIDRQRYRGGAEMVEDLPAVLAEATRLARAKGRRPGDDYVGMAVASYDGRKGHAAGHLIANGAELYPPSVNYQPGTVIGGALGFHTPLDHAKVFGEGSKLSNPAHFNPERDAAVLLHYQRDHEYETGPDGPFSAVGGAGVLTTVSANGVESRVVCEWPGDRIGERIRPKGQRLH